MDHTSDEYKADLAKMHEERNTIYRNGFFAMADALRIPQDMLKHYGYKTNEEKLVATYRDHQKKADKVLEAYLKKYPD